MAKVLFVDDDTILLDIGVMTLESLGYQVVTATNGQEALTVLAQAEADIGLILLDLLMPIMGGEACLPHIKRDFPHIPVIICTGISQEQIARELMQKGASDVLPKPYRRADVQAMLQKHGLIP